MTNKIKVNVSKEKIYFIIFKLSFPLLFPVQKKLLFLKFIELLVHDLEEFKLTNPSERGKIFNFSQLLEGSLLNANLEINDLQYETVFLVDYDNT